MLLISFLKLSFRKLKKDKFHTFINIFSLSVGISACLLILLYVKSELSYDRYHRNADRVYRVNTELHIQGMKDKFAYNSASIGKKLEKFFPEIESSFRLLPVGKPLHIQHRGKAFQEEDVAYADTSLLSFFDYKLIQGKRKAMLSQPNTAIISNEKAVQYFGSVENAMHKSLVQVSTDKKLKIVGVFEAEKRNTHLDFDIFISFRTLPEDFLSRSEDDLMWMNSIVYIMLRKDAQFKNIETKLKYFYKEHISPFLEKYKNDGAADEIVYYFQPLTEIHFSNEFQYDFASNTNPDYIYIFSFVGLFILLIASINYMNLATAKSTKRAKEVGIRKVVGASRTSLIQHFLGESFLVTFLAYLLSLILAVFLLPIFNYLTDKNLSFLDLLEIEFLLYSLLGLVMLAIISGSYPAFYLAKLKPISVLKSSVSHKNPDGHFGFYLSPKKLRKILVVIQFSLSIAMITSTVVVFSQVHFMQNKNLGFDKDQILVIDMPLDKLIAEQIKDIKKTLTKNDNIKKVSASSSLPSIRGGRISITIEADGTEATKIMNVVRVDKNFLDLLNISISEGQSFSEAKIHKDSSAIIINDTTGHYLRWRNPIGKKINSAIFNKGRVVGVVRDFHYASLKTVIEPLIIVYSPEAYSYLLVKFGNENTEKVLAHIKRTWAKFDIQYPLEYFYLDKNFKELYQREKKLLALYAYFAVLTIVISCLGLFGLTSFTTEQRLKEIGIRKTLGASKLSIVKLISKDVLILIVLANTVAIPSTIYFMGQWLNTFAYHISLTPFPFVLSTSVTLLIGLLTAGFVAVKAAGENPANVLNSE